MTEKRTPLAVVDPVQHALEDLRRRVEFLESKTERTNKVSILAYVKGLSLDDQLNAGHGSMAVDILIAILPVIAVVIGAVYDWWWPLVGWTSGKATFDIASLATRRALRKQPPSDP